MKKLDMRIGTDAYLEDMPLTVYWKIRRAASAEVITDLYWIFGVYLNETS